MGDLTTQCPALDTVIKDSVNNGSANGCTPTQKRPICGTIVIGQKIGGAAGCLNKNKVDLGSGKHHVSNFDKPLGYAWLQSGKITMDNQGVVTSITRTCKKSSSDFKNITSTTTGDNVVIYDNCQEIKNLLYKKCESYCSLYKK